MADKFFAGDTVAWTEGADDYRASDGWSATKYFEGLNSFTLDGVANGEDFDFTLTADRSAGLVAGKYKVFTRVSKLGEVHTLEASIKQIEILANPATIGSGYDARSIWEIRRDNLEQVMKAHSVKGYESCTGQMPNGVIKSVKNMTWEEIDKAHAYAEYRIRQDENKQCISTGKGGRKILMRFPGVS